MPFINGRSTSFMPLLYPVLPSGGGEVLAPLPGLWWTTIRHWFSRSPCEATNVECQVSTSFVWLGTSLLNTMTTPLESFISAGQQDSNLTKETCQRCSVQAALLIFDKTKFYTLEISSTVPQFHLTQGVSITASMVL